MIFLMTGTYPLHFNRLLKKMDEFCAKGLVDEEVYAQTGHCTYKPEHIRCKEFFDKEEFDKTMFSASALVGHAGMGIISTALEYGKPILVMPRLKKYGEIVNDHQVETARIFEEKGHILVAYTEEELEEKLGQLKNFVPESRGNQADHVVRRIEEFLIETF